MDTKIFKRIFPKISWVLILFLLAIISALAPVIHAEENVGYTVYDFYEDGSVSAATLETSTYSWLNPVVYYCVTDERLVKPIELAFQIWRDDPHSSVDSVYSGLCDRVDFDNGVNEIGFWTPGDREFSQNPFANSPSKVGIAPTKWSKTEKRPFPILEADILFQSWETFEYLNLALALHEIGHLYGIQHSDDPNSVMYPVINRSNIQLTVDELVGIRSLYPRVYPEAGFFISWQFEKGETQSPPDYIAGVFSWDGRRWQHWYPGMPTYVNSLTLREYTSYWVLFR